MKLLNTIQRYDIIVFMCVVNAHLHMSLSRLCRLISKTGDGPLYLITALVAISHDGFTNSLFQVILIAFLIERPLYFVLKNSLKRNRPQEVLTDFQSLIVPHDQFSFPSGHTSAAFMMATIGSAFWPLLTLPLYFWAAGVGFSRVLLGVHFPSDVMVGAVLGTSIAYLSLQLAVL